MENLNKEQVMYMLKQRLIFGKSQKHWYHIVTVSPWPLMGSLAALTLTVGGVMFMHSYPYGG